MDETSRVTITQYRLDRTVGQGTFGKVKCIVHELFNPQKSWNHVMSVCAVGFHVLTGKPVAIKILNKKKIKTVEMMEKIHREISVIKKCVHPHITRLW